MTPTFPPALIDVAAARGWSEQTSRFATFRGGYPVP
jgi:hypothetical protein